MIDDELLSFPYCDGVYSNGTADSGNTYNHKKLWNEVKPKGCSKPFNYYPRGRVVISKKGKATIYMNPNIDDKFIDGIKSLFGLDNSPKIKYDNSNHYKCYLDSEWKPLI